MIPGVLTPDGALYVSLIAPQPGDTFMGGMAFAPDGALRVTGGSAPQVFANGFGLMNIGALAVNFGGVIENYQQGLPFTAGGRLMVQLNQPVSPGDSYVGGIRVGPLGGVYVVDTAPPVPTGFSSGFSSGFGA